MPDEESLAVLGDNLRRHRQAKKLSQAELARQAGLSRVGYRNIETGGAAPRADTLARLAAALRVGLDDLVRPVSKLESVRFRARKRMTTREAILADVSRWLEAYTSLEEMLGAHVDYALRDVGRRFARRKARTRPIDAAAAAREALNLGEGETIRDICGLLEDNGIKVFAPEIASDQFFGLSVGPGDGGPAVVVNTWDRITVERWIFTAAHELGHLLLHHDAYDVDRTEEPEGEEKEADLFASHFLVPDEVFRREWEEARGLAFVDAVLKVKSIFRVSWKTIVYRIASDHPNPGDVWRRFYRDYPRLYGRKLSGKDEPARLDPEDFYPDSPQPADRLRDEPEHLNASLFREDRLRRLVRRALDDERISLSRAAEILDLPVKDMRQLAGAWLE